jgi:hypothetical protein
MYVNLNVLSQFVPYLPLILPFVVTILAGILRQDGLKPNVNKGITTILVLAAACVAAFYNHALTSNLALDLTVILGYTTVIIRLPDMQKLQGYIQSNWLNVIANEAKTLAAQPVQAPQFTTQVPQPAIWTNTVTSQQPTSTFIQPNALPTVQRNFTELEIPIAQPPAQ